MTDVDEPTITVYEDDDGGFHLSIDRPGREAESAPLPYGSDGIDLLRSIADGCGLEVEGSDTTLVISIPPGA